MDLYSTKLKVYDAVCQKYISFIFCFSAFISLEEIEIGNENFPSSEKFILDSLHQLKSLKIGGNSFTNHENSYGFDYTRSFHILNCGKLELIAIARYSFSDFAGEFELKSLPSLKSIEMGEYDKSSNCFYGSSFIIKGMDALLTNIIDLPSLKTIQLGYDVFAVPSETVIHSTCQEFF